MRFMRFILTIVPGFRPRDTTKFVRRGVAGAILTANPGIAGAFGAAV